MPRLLAGLFVLVSALSALAQQPLKEEKLPPPRPVPEGKQPARPLAFEVLPIRDNLPHYSGFPAAFGGSDDRVDW